MFIKPLVLILLIIAAGGFALGAAFEYNLQNGLDQAHSSKMVFGRFGHRYPMNPWPKMR